jgi:hypothetical protein
MVRKVVPTPPQAVDRTLTVPKARNLNNPTRNEVPCGESGHPVQTGVPKARNKNKKN